MLQECNGRHILCLTKQYLKIRIYAEQYSNNKYCSVLRAIVGRQGVMWPVNSFNQGSSCWFFVGRVKSCCWICALNRALPVPVGCEGGLHSFAKKNNNNNNL